MVFRHVFGALSEAQRELAGLLVWLVAVFALAALIAVSACAPTTIKVPVPERPTPPPELTAPLALTPPVFVAPSHPQATSALTPEGERRLKTLLLDLFERTNAWQAWAAP